MATELRAPRGRARARAPCRSYNIVIATTVITSRKVFLHNQHYLQFRVGMGHLEIPSCVHCGGGS